MQKDLIKEIQKLQALSTELQAICMLSLSEKLLLTQWATSQGIKVFWIEHDRVGRWLTKNPWLGKLRKLSRLATTIVVSDLSRKIYEGLGWSSERVVAIPNGVKKTVTLSSVEVQQSDQHPSFDRAQDDTGILHLGCITRLSADKGVDLLIEAVSDMPEITLSIVGRGNEEHFIRKLIEERSLGDRVKIIPWIDDLPSFYRSLDALVLASREHDPFGLVAAEAMMIGIPVIVTDVCGIAGYLQNGSDAIIVEANSTPALREAIEKMMDPELRARLGVNGRNAAREKFSLEKMVNAYEKIMNHTL